MSKPFNLPALRGKLGLDQAQMAECMGLDARDYVELETSPEKVQRRHAMLAHLVSLDVAIEKPRDHHHAGKDSRLASIADGAGAERVTRTLLIR
jgi:hypothetical protein